MKKSPVLAHPLLRGTAAFFYNTLIRAKYKSLWLLNSHLEYLPRYLSEKGQDKWIIEDVFPLKESGFFLEIGAMDGFTGSNTFILEKSYNWAGICVEPNPALYKTLVARRGCTCVSDCVDRFAGNVDFYYRGSCGGIVTSGTDNDPDVRCGEISNAYRDGKIEPTETITLVELLEKYNAPKSIEYFSLDIEGAEERILDNFPFDQYVFLALTVERPSMKLNAVLADNDYVFVKNSFYDSFYVHRSIESFEGIEKQPFWQIPAKTY